MRIENNKTIRIAKQKLMYLNYAPSTISTYVHYMQVFLSNQQKQPIHLSAADFTDYLARFKFSSRSQQNQVISALKFLYTYVLHRKYGKVNFARPRKVRQLPKVIAHDTLVSAFSRIKNVKHMAILSLGYACALRVSELVNLKMRCIDRSRMMIRIENSKGNKDRLVPISLKMMHLLDKYYQAYKPVEYLFNGQGSIQYSAASCNKLVKKYLGAKYHFHMLRHSCATRMHETGTDIFLIQKFLGHSSFKTTQIYTHISNASLCEIRTAI